MFRVAVAPQWTIAAPDGRALGARVVALLVQVEAHGSLARACTASGVSYRHAWQLLREAEALFGHPLLVMARGKGSELTPLGQRLVWAQRRVQARLAPVLDSLASELGAEIAKVLDPPAGPLRLHASHGFAVQALHEALVRAGTPHELRYGGGTEALESLARGQCDLAGLHLPIGTFEAATVAHHRRWLDPAGHSVIRLATRRLGLMVAPGNPRRIYELADLTRPDIRFVNRQAGSGTRLLLEQMLAAAGIDPAAIRGYPQCELTHAAVAAAVAGGLADAGLGLELPAREFRLDFIPLQQERYFLLCRSDALGSPALQATLAILRGPEYTAALAALPGYAPDDTGRVMPLAELLPTLQRRRR